MAKRTKRTSYFNIKPPYRGEGSRRGKRASFALIKAGTPATTIDDSRIKNVNKRFLSGEASYETCLLHMQEIRDEYEKSIEIIPAVNIHNSDNLKIFQSIWEDDYQYRDIVSGRGRMIEFARIFELLSHRSILTISLPDLQALINEACSANANRQRRWVSVANQILKFIFSRGIASPIGKLKMKKKTRSVVQHVSLEEMGKIIELVEDEKLKALYYTAFVTGCRLGELLRLTPDRFTEADGGLGFLLVQGQLVKQERAHEGDSAPTNFRSELKEVKKLKNQTDRRTALVLPEGRAYLKAWLSVPMEARILLRKSNYNAPLSKACKELFPDEEVKQVSLHGLRHSYAIHLLRLGMSLEDVAKSIGDTLEVCEEFYAGFAHTPETVQSMADRYISKTTKMPH